MAPRFAARHPVAMAPPCPDSSRAARSGPRMRLLTRSLHLGVVLLALGCQPPQARPSPPPAPDARAYAELLDATQRFLHAFDHMEWEAFRAAWAANPSVFFPFRDTPERVEGPAVATRFRAFFTEVTATRPGPPYLRLTPLQVRAEVLGSTGLVTFMLGQAAGGVGRRTLLFVREGDQWKLAHMHASNAERAAP